MSQKIKGVKTMNQIINFLTERWIMPFWAMALLWLGWILFIIALILLIVYDVKGKKKDLKYSNIEQQNVEERDILAKIHETQEEEAKKLNQERQELIILSNENKIILERAEASKAQAELERKKAEELLKKKTDILANIKIEKNSIILEQAKLEQLKSTKTQNKAKK